MMEFFCLPQIVMVIGGNSSVGLVLVCSTGGFPLLAKGCFLCLPSVGPTYKTGQQADFLCWPNSVFPLLVQPLVSDVGTTAYFLILDIMTYIMININI